VAQAAAAAPRGGGPRHCGRGRGDEDGRGQGGVPCLPDLAPGAAVRTTDQGSPPPDQGSPEPPAGEGSMKTVRAEVAGALAWEPDDCEYARRVRSTSASSALSSAHGSLTAKGSRTRQGSPAAIGSSSGSSRPVLGEVALRQGGVACAGEPTIRGALGAGTSASRLDAAAPEGRFRTMRFGVTGALSALEGGGGI
jgi:hypothetical protein